MFRDSHLRRYFSKIGTSKLQTSNASESVPSIGSDDGGIHAPIIELGSSSIKSVVGQREYPACDPRYVHAMRQTPKRSCETPHNVCHQPWQKRVCRSNPVVMLITPERLGVPRSAGVVDLMLPNHVEHETIKLSSDSFNIDDYQDKADADVLEWISTNIGKKVSYVATRRF
jgi:hypothetical protein